MNTLNRYDVQKQLKRILNSDAFRTACAKSEFLSYVVNQTLAGSEHLIKAYVIGVEGLNLKESFDPQKSSRVRVLAVRVRQTLEAYYRQAGKIDPIIIKLPARSYVPVFSKNRAYIGHEKVPASFLDELSIMVLPFDCFHSHPMELAISRYLVDSLGSRLTLFPELFFIPVQMAAGSKSETGHRMPENSKPRFIITGSVIYRNQDASLNITLINTRSGRQLWARQFENIMGLGSLGLLQETVVKESVGIIGGVAGKILNRQNAAPFGPVSPETAMACYTELFRQPPTLTHLEQIEDALEKALEQAPMHATLHCMLAHLNIAGFYWGVFRNPDRVTKANDHISKALMAEPDNPFACVMGAFKNIQANRTGKALSDIKRAIEKNENDVFLMTIAGYFLFMLGQYDQGEELVTRAEKINPFMTHYNQVLFFTKALHLGHYEKALEAAERFYIPGFFWSHLLYAVALGLLEHRQAAEQAVMKLLNLRPDFASNYVFYLSYLAPATMWPVYEKGLKKAGLTLFSSSRAPCVSIGIP